MNLFMALGFTWGVVTAVFGALLFHRRQLVKAVDYHVQKGATGPPETELAMKIQLLKFPIRATGLLSFLMYLVTLCCWLIHSGLSAI